MASTQNLTLRGVRTHNLKSIDVDIPLHRLSVVTGCRGAGKRSLVFDTLFAEAQRRYLRSVSSEARQALARVHADVDEIGSLPPAVAIDCFSTLPSPAETIGSLTGIGEWLERLFAHCGVVDCPACRKPVQTHGAADVIATLLAMAPGTRCTLAFPVAAPDASEQPGWLASLAEEGFFRIQIGEAAFRVGQQTIPALAPGDTVWILIDRIEIGKTADERIAESVHVAFRRGGGRIGVWIDKEKLVFHRELRCAGCDRVYQNADRLLAGRTSDAWHAEPLTTLLAWTADLPANHAIQSLRSRLQTLVNLALGHVTLGQSAAVLSDGDACRVALARALACGLGQILYVIDEPTGGLHPRQTPGLIDALRVLRDQGNTVVVIEHDRAVIAAADHVIDLGPQGGAEGGWVLYQGPPAGLASAAASLTGTFLSGRQHVRPPSQRRTPTQFLTLTGVHVNNLHDIEIVFPLGVLCAITGASGAGKKSLVVHALYPALSAVKQNAEPGPSVRAVRGAELVAEVVLLDRQPTPRRSRACLATAMKILDEIRDLFAQTADAKARNFGPGHFSFNQVGGRCETCEGRGAVAVDLPSLEAAATPCPTCRGARYREDILDIAVRNKNIAEVLALTVRDAFRFFHAHAAMEKKLKMLLDVSLDYIRLGEPMESLSPGECQRLALAVHLASHRKAGCLFLWIEPSAGQHPADITDLLACFDRLLTAGHSLIVVDNDQGVVGHADCVIELDGGRVVA
ncbi:MAG: hypothetical protein HYR84_12145 [Planctomycetes bacterium]|nr:hypothetical protein [Planctomycetota bacterium]